MGSLGFRVFFCVLHGRRKHVPVGNIKTDCDVKFKTHSVYSLCVLHLKRGSNERGQSAHFECTPSCYDCPDWRRPDRKRLTFWEVLIMDCFSQMWLFFISLSFEDAWFTHGRVLGVEVGSIYAGIKICSTTKQCAPLY